MAVFNDMSPCSRSVLITFTVRVTTQHPVNINYLKNLVHHIKWAQSVSPSKNRNLNICTRVLSQNKIYVLVLVRVIQSIISINLYAPELVFIFYLRNKTSQDKIQGTRALITRTQTSTYILFCDKTRVPMFYFDSNTTRPIDCTSLICYTKFFRNLILIECRLVKQSIINFIMFEPTSTYASYVQLAPCYLRTTCCFRQKTLVNYLKGHLLSFYFACLMCVNFRFRVTICTNC